MMMVAGAGRRYLQICWLNIFIKKNFQEEVLVVELTERCLSQIPRKKPSNYVYYKYECTYMYVCIGGAAYNITHP